MASSTQQQFRDILAKREKEDKEGITKDEVYTALSLAPGTGEAIAVKELPDDIQQIKKLFEEGYRESDFKKLGMGALYTTAVTAGLIPVLGPVGRAGKKILKKGVDEAESLFKTQTDLMTKGPTGGSGGEAVETAGVGQLDETKKLLKDETKTITTNIPNSIPADEIINAPTINPTMAGMNTPTGKLQARRFMELESKGNITPEKLFEETGVYRGQDSKLRYEIDDRNAKFVKGFKPKNGEDYALYKVLKFDDLYKEYGKDLTIDGTRYGSLRNVRVNFVKDTDSYLGKYEPNVDEITINLSTVDNTDPEKIISTLLHEVQHAVQRREGFITGTSTEFQLKQSPNYDKYLKAKEFVENRTVKDKKTGGMITPEQASRKQLVEDELYDQIKPNTFPSTIRREEYVNQLNNEIRIFNSFIKVPENRTRLKEVLARDVLKKKIDNTQSIDLKAGDVAKETMNLLTKKIMDITKKSKNEAEIYISRYAKKIEEARQSAELINKEQKIAKEKYYTKYGEKEASLVQQRYERRMNLKKFNLDDKIVKGDMRLETDFIKGEDSNLGQMGGFNKGGDIMKKQMELFDEGGLKDEGNTVDPVSGNDVPPGATQEEVRDDIPARLSEGEFVFPADVVRFIGLEKLMQMRQKAKAGLARMEEMGQMGNSEEATVPDDAPFSIEDLDMEEETEYNQGGIVKAQTGIYVAPGTGIIQPQTPNTRTTGVSSYTAPMIPSTNPTPTGGYKPMFYNQADTQGVTPSFQSIIGRNPGQYDEFREYVNDAGMKLQIPFKDGQPLYPIPEGYTYVDPEATKTEDVKVKEATTQSTSVLQGEDGGDSEGPGGATDPAGDPFGYSSIGNFDNLDKQMASIGNMQLSVLGKGIGQGLFSAVTNTPEKNQMKLAAITPIFTKAKKRNNILGLNLATVKNPEIRNSIAQDVERMSNAIDRITTKVTFDDKGRATETSKSTTEVVTEVNELADKYGLDKISTKNNINVSSKIGDKIAEINQAIQDQPTYSEDPTDTIESVDPTAGDVYSDETQTTTAAEQAANQAAAQSFMDSTTTENNDSGGGFSDADAAETGMGAGDDEDAIAKGSLVTKRKASGKLKKKYMKRGGLASR